MKDIGYYAGFLSDDEQARINSASADQLLDLIETLVLTIATQPFDEIEIIGISDFWASDSATSPNKLALIRGLCDRIELKLMEQAN